MSGEAGWGDDEWLMDRDFRRRWLRFRSLHDLGEQILRTTAGPRDAVACLLDELFEAATPLPKAKITRCVREDISRFGTWLRDGVSEGARRAKRYQAVAVILTDGAPYGLQLALVNASPNDDDWAESIVWRSTGDLALALLDQLLPRTMKLDAAIQGGADYILPLAYTAFLLRDAACNDRSRKRWTGLGAVVVYAGGDEIIVPLK